MANKFDYIDIAAFAGIGDPIVADAFNGLQKPDCLLLDKHNEALVDLKDVVIGWLRSIIIGDRRTVPITPNESPYLYGNAIYFAVVIRTSKAVEFLQDLSRTHGEVKIPFKIPSLKDKKT